MNCHVYTETELTSILFHRIERGEYVGREKQQHLPALQETYVS